VNLKNRAATFPWNLAVSADFRAANSAPPSEGLAVACDKSSQVSPFGLVLSPHCDCPDLAAPTSLIVSGAQAGKPEPVPGFGRHDASRPGLLSLSATGCQLSVMDTAR